MTITDLQQRLGIATSGQWDAQSKTALLAKFTNPSANRLNGMDIAAAASRLGCSPAQIRAVRRVEAAGSGFDARGRPVILFERHKFHGFTGGKFSVAPFSDPKRGGYDVSSWAKLVDAIGTGAVDAAFMSCSWGAFQVLGEWWHELGYPSPYALAWTTVQSEGDQLELLIRFVEHFGLTDELQRLSSIPASCAPFAAAYNGPAYRVNHYDTKLAQAMVA